MAQFQGNYTTRPMSTAQQPSPFYNVNWQGLFNPILQPLQQRAEESQQQASPAQGGGNWFQQLMARQVPGSASRRWAESAGVVGPAASGTAMGATPTQAAPMQQAQQNTLNAMPAQNMGGMNPFSGGLLSLLMRQFGGGGGMNRLGQPTRQDKYRSLR